MKKIQYNGLLIDRNDYIQIIQEKQKWEFDFIKEYYLEKENRMTWAEIDDLVKIYKSSENESEKLELEEIIFHQNFTILYYEAKKNTYVSDFNKDDLVGVIFLTHRYLLNTFNFNHFTTQNTLATLSFRMYLKSYFKTKFHRYFIESSNSCSSLSNYKDRYNNHYMDCIDSVELKEKLFNQKNMTEYDQIEKSDINIKEKLKNIICKRLPKEQASAVLKTFNFIRMGRDKRTSEQLKKDCRNGLKTLQLYKSELKELLDYIKLFNDNQQEEI